MQMRSSLQPRSRCETTPAPRSMISSMLSMRRCCLSLELRAPIYMDRVAGEPPSLLRSEKTHDPTDVVRLSNALDGLHPQRCSAPRLRFRKARHFGLDHAGRYGVDANALGAERSRKVLHHRGDGAFGRRVRREMAHRG